jgi:alpha-glucosidase
VPKPRTPTLRSVQNLRVAETTSDQISLRSKSFSVRIRALADDLFHLRVLRTPMPPEPSWAVIKTDWPSTSSRVERRGSTIALQTDAARFRFHLKTGAWSITDRHGLEVFSAPAGATGFVGSQARLSLTLSEREALFGLGETTGTFNKRGLIREFWNIDVLGHAPAIHPGLRNLYVSIPFALSLRDGRVAGLFWDNPARQTWDLGQTTPDTWTLTSASGPVDLYLFTGPKIAPVLERYTELTGRMPLPPRWALGYQQSRYSYETRERLEAVADEFRRRQLPCDVLHCDIHHMDGHRVFTFGADFPKPASMIAGLAKRGFKVVAIANPGVKDTPRFDVLRRGRKLDAFVKDPSGNKDAWGEVWPGRSCFPDFLNAKTRTWWGSEQAAHLRQGVAGIWNDMNEPANFGRPDKTLDPEALHHTDHGPRRHHQVHNLYGMQMARASREGMLLRAADGGKAPASAAPHRIARPFVITRAGYAGIQRHAVVWTGDNTSCWEHLNDSLQMLLNLGLSGVPFVGSDVGGFLDNTTPELWIRWLQMAVFTPFLRNHSNIDTVAQEPWAFGPRIEEIARDSLHLRYQLIPYLYGLFQEASRTGAPMMRPLLWHYPNDPVAAACSDQFLVGENLMVAPILRQGAVARSVYLPRGEWFDFWSGELFQGGVHVVLPAPLERIPILVRSGTILPMKTVRQFIGPREPSNVVLHLWARESGHLDWYDDDGRTQAFTTGMTQTRRLQTHVTRSGGRLEIGPIDGPYAGSTRSWRVVLRGITRECTVQVDGKEVDAEYVPEIGIVAFDMPAVPHRTEAKWR